jgi:mRNA-degrading endonuclease toxin of MazEF toxin-antitoxin module
VSTLERGRIVYVELLDPQGRNKKRRPAIILTASEEITPEGEVTVVAISSQLDQAPADAQVELPWHAQRHPRTGLSERCAAVCSWVLTVPVQSIVGQGGKVTGTHLIRILEKVAALRPEEAGEEKTEEPKPDAN